MTPLKFPNSLIRVPAELAANNEGQGASTRRPAAVYMDILEDTSTEATPPFVSAVELCENSIVKSVEETQALAQKLVALLEGHGVISLEGPLGAGKTHFVKGIAKAFDLKEEVTSPTFTLLQTYGSRKNLVHHFDFYRLNTVEEAFDLGLEECFEEGITVIEWGDKFLSLLPKGTLRIRLYPLEGDVREISWHIHD